MKKISLLLVILITLSACQIVSKNKEEKNIDFSMAKEVYGIMQKKSIDLVDVETKDLDYGLARGLVGALGDPHSDFFNPEEANELENNLQGNFYGIGAELSEEDGQIVVISPLIGSPAEKAGLLPKDVIIEVDGEEIDGENIYDVVMKIRGELGTEVILTVLRPEISELKKISITRDEIHEESVDWNWADEDAKIAHLILKTFSENTADEVFKVLEEILAEDPSGIIFDLRFNGGGFFYDSIMIASYFLKPDAEVVEVRGKDPEKNITHKALGFNYCTDLPLVVLINGGSASASEIVAGALKDNQRAKIIGEQSFGKGTVQEVIDLSDGSILNLTIGRWYTPSGVSIDHEGITPDEVVEMKYEDLLEGKDLQLEKAIEVLK